MLRNKLKYYRHVLQFDKQKDFAEWLDVSGYNLNRWENQAMQPDTVSLWNIYRKLKTRLPELHMEDLIEECPE